MQIARRQGQWRNTACSANAPFKDGTGVRQVHSDKSVRPPKILKGWLRALEGGVRGCKGRWALVANT
jgi:hypothetical protein